MREILFRAKRKNWRELPKEEWWVEGSYHHQTDYYGDPCDKHYIIDGTETDMEGYGGHYEIDPETLCQYTGLKDKNGNRIWENDVVKDDNKLLLGAVIWFQNGYDYVGWFLDEVSLIEPMMMSEQMWNDCEVLGNIFDNPELLGGHDEQMA